MIVGSVTVCLGVANSKYRQGRQTHQHNHLEHVYSSCDEGMLQYWQLIWADIYHAGKQVEQLAMYLSPNKLHTQPTIRKQKEAIRDGGKMGGGEQELDPVYEELESHQTGASSFYQQLSTISRDYMTVYSITKPQPDHTPQQSPDHTPQQPTTDEPDEPDHSQHVIKLDEAATSAAAAACPGEQPLAGEEQLAEEEITIMLKRGLKIQYSNTSMGSYVAMKPSD